MSRGSINYDGVRFRGTEARNGSDATTSFRLYIVFYTWLTRVLEKEMGGFELRVNFQLAGIDVQEVSIDKYLNEISVHFNKRTFRVDSWNVALQSLLHEIRSNKNKNEGKNETRKFNKK